MIYSSVLVAYKRQPEYNVTISLSSVKMSQIVHTSHETSVTPQPKPPLTFSVIHRRHFEEAGYVIRMLTWMLTMRNRAHNYDTLPRQIKCFDYA